MGANLGQDGRSGRGVPTALAEINVTPLVDVMLVLLIIFMVTAPLLQQGLAVELPKATGSPLRDANEPVILVVDKQQQILLNGSRVPAGALKGQLEAMASSTPELEVYIQADATLPYGVVAQVISEAAQAGVRRIGLVTTPPQRNRRL